MRALLFLTITLLGAFALPLEDCKNETCDQPLTFSSFNAHLENTTTQIKNRTVALSEFFSKDNESDFLCLQEMGSPLLVKYFIEQMPERWKYNFYATKNLTCTKGCLSDDLQSVRGCFNTSNCTADNFTCIFEKCSDTMLSLEDTCQICLGESKNISFLDQLSVCEGKENATSNKTECINPVDNLLLSVYPLNITAYGHFNDSKGILFALAELPDGDQINLFCADFSSATSNESLANQKLQIMETIVLIDIIVPPNQLTLLMGEFSTSPSSENVSFGLANESFELLNDTLENYTNIYIECKNESNCKSYPSQLIGSEQNTTIDHIFVFNDKNHCLLNVSSIFPYINITEGSNNTEEGSNSTGGSNSTLSDVFGIKMSLCFQPNSTSPSGSNANETVSPSVHDEPGSANGSIHMTLSILLVIISLIFFVV